MADQELCNAIVDAVSYWLGYQFKIGRDRLIHEASLRYPIADTLTAQGAAIHTIVLEKAHPVFKSKLIDVVLYAEDVEEPEAEKDDSRLQKAFEFKLAKIGTSIDGSSEHQRVFDDVVRLAYYNMWRKKDCYFLMCGKYDEFKAYFVGQNQSAFASSTGNTVPPRRNRTNGGIGEEKWAPVGLYADWFDFAPTREKKKIFRVADSNQFGLSSFHKRYEPRENSTLLTDTIEIKTTCMAITPAGEKNRTHAVGIWKIEA